MTLDCWACERHYPDTEFIEITVDDLRFYGRRKLRVFKHLRCKKRTAFFATAAVKAGRLAPA